MSNIAASKGHQSKIYDCFVEDSDIPASVMAEADWIIVATTPYHMWQCPNSDWEWIKKSLNFFPKDKTLLTGLHASVFPKQTLEETGVLGVISREPEVVLKAFFDSCDWRATPGVSFVEASELHTNSSPTLPSMDDLVVRDYCVDIRRYGYFLLGENTGVFEASRGCPWKCTFCDQEMFSWKYRRKSPEIFAEEVSAAVTATAMRTAYFYDLEFTVSKKRTLELCDELIKRKVNERLRWCCQTRADTVDLEVLTALKEAGCVLVHYGVESANPDILASTNKKITLEQIAQGVRLSKKVGIQTACFFMFGLPGEEESRFINTLDFARDLNPTYASFHFAIPFPGTPLYDQYLKVNELKAGTWPSTYFQGWTQSEISKFVSSAYRKFYLMPRRFEFREFFWRATNLNEKIRYFRSV